MKRNILVGLVVMATISCGASLASAAQQPYIGQLFDFGDMRGGFNTYNVGNEKNGQWPQMSVNFAVSSGSITGSSIYVSPNTWWDQNNPGKSYFDVNVFINGSYDTPPAYLVGSSQSSRLTHHGVSIYENSYLGSYLSGDSSGKGTSTPDTVWQYTSADVTFPFFTPVDGSSNLDDSTWFDSWNNVTHNDFNFSVHWIGYTTNSVVAAMLSGLSSMTITNPSSAVPEPASLGLLAFGAVGLLARRRR